MLKGSERNARQVLRSLIARSTEMTPSKAGFGKGMKPSFGTSPQGTSPQPEITSNKPAQRPDSHINGLFILFSLL
jgi:hypothetical protein